MPLLLPFIVDFKICSIIYVKLISMMIFLVATTTGHLLEVPWAFLDPRRPLGEPKEEGAIPYIPELPMPFESMINYNKSLLRVDGIYTTPSSLESTCLVFVYGLGNFTVLR